MHVEFRELIHPPFFHFSSGSHIKYLSFLGNSCTMATHPVEIILSRQLADYLSVPIFLVDTNGDLIFYNEPAEEFLGKRFEDTGPMSVEEWSTIFKYTDEHGNAVPRQDLPLVKSLTLQEPAQGELWFEGLHGKKYHLSVTSLPLIGEAHRFVGALAIFWEK